MRANYQLYPTSDPDAGVFGDCLRTCIASLLDLTTEEVPHFLHDNSDEWLVRLNRWLAAEGKAYLLLPVPSAEVIPQMFHMHGMNSFHLLTVRTASGVIHQLVGMNGAPYWCPILGDVQGRKYEILEIGFLVCTSL